MNYEYQETYEFQPEFEYEGEMNHEMHENELAHELMNIQNEQELEYFLGGLLKSAWSGAKTLYNSPIGQQLKGQAISGLKSLGKRALPGLGSAIGGRFFGPAGARIGGQLGNMAVRGLGLEFEGMAPRDKRFEGSRRLIRVAKSASRRIAAYARSGQPISARTVRNIILQEGRRWFPGLPSPAPVGGGSGFQSSGGGYAMSTGQNQGTWVRQGNRIIIQGV
jgi:hypothetical protein